MGELQPFVSAAPGGPPVGDHQPLQVMIDHDRPARVLEISALGAWVEPSSALRPLAVHQVTVPTGAGPLRMQAQVLHCRATAVTAAEGGSRLGYRACLDFLGLGEQEIHALIAAYGTAPLRGLEWAGSGGRQALRKAV